jgi:hypothetical protein
LPGPVNNIRFINNKPVLCTWSGTWQLDASANRIHPFTPGPLVDPSFVIGDMIERNGVYYLANEQELLKYVPRENKLYRPTFLTTKLPDGQLPQIKRICLTSDNKLWFVTAFAWLAYLDDNNTLIPFYVVKNKNEELNGWLNSLAADRSGRLWIAAPGIGLYGIFPSQDSAKLWNETDGLVHNHVQNVIADDNGDIWCAAYNRFSVFSPGTGSFYNFILPLCENTFDYENGLGQLSNGHIVACLEKNIVEFFPERLALKPRLAKPIIGAVNIAGTQKLLSMDSTLQLNPDEKFVSFKFGLMTDKETFPYELEYRLIGFDDKWSVAGDDNQAVYNKLPSGNYTFQLKARAKNGNWESPETTLKIHVKTPFDRSSLVHWACSVYDLRTVVFLLSFSH